MARALPAAATYDKMDRPYNANMQRSSFVDATQNVPGTTQEEGGRTIKTGEALTDVWIDTWIKSRTYQAKTQGFMLDSKGGYIECMYFSIGTGIDMYGNDAYFYDYTEASGGTFVQTATASLNFMRKYYDDQNFIMQKRVGYQSPSADNSDNVFEMFYENPAQGSRRNYIFLGRKGATFSTSDEHTDVVQIHGKQLIQQTTDVMYGTPDISLTTGAYDGNFAHDSTRLLVICKDETDTGYFSPIKTPAQWTAGAIIFAIKKPAYGSLQNNLLILDDAAAWVGMDFLPMGDGVISLGSPTYKFLNIYASTVAVSTISATSSITSPILYFTSNGSNYLQFVSGRVEINSQVYASGTISAGGDLISGGNVQSLGGVVRVGSYNFTTQNITYKDGAGVSQTRRFLVA